MAHRPAAVLAAVLEANREANREAAAPEGAAISRPGRRREDRVAPADPPWKRSPSCTIAQQDGEVTITDKEGHTRVLKTDGSKSLEEKGPGGSAEIRANWEKDGTLTVKVKPKQGPKRTETYIVSNDGKHLYVTTFLESDGKRPDRKFRRAYDPAE